MKVLKTVIKALVALLILLLLKTVAYGQQSMIVNEDSTFTLELLVPKAKTTTENKVEKYEAQFLKAVKSAITSTTIPAKSDSDFTLTFNNAATTYTVKYASGKYTLSVSGEVIVKATQIAVIRSAIMVECFVAVFNKQPSL